MSRNGGGLKDPVAACRAKEEPLEAELMQLPQAHQQPESEREVSIRLVVFHNYLRVAAICPFLDLLSGSELPELPELSTHADHE